MLAFAPLPAPPPELRPVPNQSGEEVLIGRERSKAVWLWRGSDAEPEELWLPLEVLESRLGGSGGCLVSMEKHWNGLVERSH